MNDSIWFDEGIAKTYESWYEGEGRRADVQEKKLLGRFIQRFPGVRTILEVGCGTGHFTRWLDARGLWTVGLEVSPVMLNEAVCHGDRRYLRADGLKLPFVDGAFDLVALITSLEFVPNVSQALAEAVRVARRGLLLGVLNRYSLQALWCRLKGGAIWAQAHFFTPGELEYSVRQAAGKRFQRLKWRTAVFPPGLEFAAQFLPLGGFIGGRVVLVEGQMLRQTFTQVRWVPAVASTTP